MSEHTICKEHCSLDEWRTIYFDRLVNFWEENYGADADGNRGTPMAMWEDDGIENITLEDERTETTTAFADLPLEVQEAVNKAIDKHCASNTPEPPDDGPDEPDFDDDDDDPPDWDDEPYED